MGSDPETMHQAMAATVEQCYQDIRDAQQEARGSGKTTRPRWPMIVLRTPKGWTAPQEIDGHRVESFWRAHQVPLSGIHIYPQLGKLLRDVMKKNMDRFRDFGPDENTSNRLADIHEVCKKCWICPPLSITAHRELAFGNGQAMTKV